jgi:hypothetical protein
MFCLKTVAREGWAEIEDRMHVQYTVLHFTEIDYLHYNIPSPITLYKHYQCLQFHNISEALLNFGTDLDLRLQRGAVL